MFATVQNVVQQHQNTKGEGRSRNGEGKNEGDVATEYQGHAEAIHGLARAVTRKSTRKQTESHSYLSSKCATILLWQEGERHRVETQVAKAKSKTNTEKTKSSRNRRRRAPRRPRGVVCRRTFHEAKWDG